MFARKLDRARMQHLSADARHLKHLFVRNFFQQSRSRDDVRVSGVDSAHVREDVANSRAERSRKRNCRRVRAAAPQRGRVAFGGRPLKAGRDNYEPSSRWRRMRSVFMSTIRAAV